MNLLRLKLKQAEARLQIAIFLHGDEEAAETLARRCFQLAREYHFCAWSVLSEVEIDA